MRGVPICARMVRARAKSVTWIARAATGKSGGMSPALIPSRKRRSTSAAPPATALCRNRWTSASFKQSARCAHHKAATGGTLSRSHFSTAYLQKVRDRRSRALCGERSAFAADAPFRSAYALRARKNIARLSPKMAYRLGRPTPIPSTRSSIVTPS